MNKKEIATLEKTAAAHIYKILDALQIDYREHYQYVTASCPVHKGDSRSGWSYHIDKEKWMCWTNECSRKFNRGPIGLIMGTLDVSYPEALSFAKDILSGCKASVTSELSQLSSNRQFVADIKKDTIYSESALDKLMYCDYLETRNYSRAIVESYQIGKTADRYKHMANRIIIPVRNIDGAIVGFTARTLDEHYKKKGIPKWIHSKGFVSANNLFNIDRAKKYISETGVAILVEGPLDVLRLEQAGIKNSVAVFGRKLHNGQTGLLMKCSANKLKIAFDADNAGKTGARDALRTARAFFAVEIVALEDGDVGILDDKKAREMFA